MLHQLFSLSSLAVAYQLVVFLVILVFTAGFPVGVFAQEPAWRVREGMPVGSEAERYLRILQLGGKAPLYPWTVRGFTPHELAAVTPTSAEHPWQARMDFTMEPSVDPEWGWIRPKIGLISNSAYPFGENDGAMWAGRGLTAVAEFGGFFRFGPLHLRLAPDGFWAENGNFDLADNGHSGEAAYWDENRPGTIDQPQRFGDESYARLGLGSSSLSIVLPAITVGFSGASQYWGPAMHYPLLLGNNSGGFVHAFAQTSTPIDLWLLRVQGRYMFGWPKQSDFAPYRAMEEERRFAAGAAFAILPRGVDGLELGVARFIHSLLPSGSHPRGSDFLRVFSGVTQESENLRSRNQLASVFFRWAIPGAGVEVYGELLKEDFARDLRHVIEEPDDLMSRVFGFQKIWSLPEGRLTALRGEMVNAQLHHSERFDRLRIGPWPLPPYVHGGGVDHTHLGQLLGSPSAYGGSGWTLGFDLYDEEGRWSVSLSRALQTDWSAIHSKKGIADVIYAVKLEALRFRNNAEWVLAVTPSFNLNRNLVEENDVLNLSLHLSITGLPW